MSTGAFDNKKQLRHAKERPTGKRPRRGHRAPPPRPAALRLSRAPGLRSARDLSDIPAAPPAEGSRFLIWKQDPSVADEGLRALFIPSPVLDGPRDERIVTLLAGTTPVRPDVNRDFMFAAGSPELDCAHTFAVVRATLTMYQRLLGGERLPWAWNVNGNSEPITVLPRAGTSANAFYSRVEKALLFFSFRPPDSGEPIFSCRSLDVVAHECGHAVLDGLKPGWISPHNPAETAALHESFGDLTALFLACSQLDQAEAAIAECRADLHNHNFLAVLAEQFGTALGLPEGLRNADNDLTMSQVANDVYAIAQVNTGAVYDILADIFTFQRIRQVNTKDPARVLLEAAAELCGLMVRAIMSAPEKGATLADLANRMMQLSREQNDPPIYRTFIRNRYAVREVIVPPVDLTPLMEGSIDFADGAFLGGADPPTLERRRHASDRAPQERSRCCGTMQRPEHATPTVLSRGRRP